MIPPAPTAWAALLIRLTKTCVSAERLPSTGGRSWKSRCTTASASLRAGLQISAAWSTSAASSSDSGLPLLGRA